MRQDDKNTTNTIVQIIFAWYPIVEICISTYKGHWLRVGFGFRVRVRVRG
jgi:hypothetical protein